jgi:hypothetical protein
MTYTFKLARRLAILRHLVVLTVLALLVACAKDLTAPDEGSTGSSASAPSVHVLPSSVTVETSQPVRLRGLARTAGGKLESTQVAWTTSGGTINSDGVFSSSLSGTFKVVGRGRGWKNADTSVVIVVPPSPGLVRIAVTPGTATIETGATHAFTATGYLTDGSTAQVGVVWAATGGDVDPSGAYTAGSAAGSYRVIATSTSGSLADTSAVTVTAPVSTAPAPTLASVIVSPASVSLTPGSSKQFKPYGLNSVGDSVAVTASFTATGGSVTSAGLFTAGQTTGSYRVIATSNGLADTAAVSVAVASAAPAGRSLAAGFWNYGMVSETYCNSTGVSSSSQPTSTDALLAHLQDARKCNVRLVIVPGRKYITQGGTTGSPFSLTNAKAFTDRMAAVLKPDTLAKYQPWIIGFNLADDYGCAECWGGVKVTQSEIAAWASYTRTKIPGLRIGIRVEPTWAQGSTLPGLIDYAWAQYHTGKGDARTYFDKHAALAKSLGLSLAMGVNVKYCAGAGTAPCTPAQIKTFMGMAAQYPDNCALLGWEYNTTAMAQTGMADAWDYVLKLAAQHPDVTCKHL